MKPSTRDAFWLAVLCLVLGAWGWDRGRLAERVEGLTQPAPTLSQSQQAAVQALGSLQGVPKGDPLLLVPQSASDPFGPGSDAPPAGVFAEP